MKSISKNASALLFALVCGAASASPVNLVTNGSFESGLEDWSIGGTDGQGFPPAAIEYNSATDYPTGAFGEAVPQNNAATNSPDEVGTRAAYFVSDLATNQSLFQTINILTDGFYQIGFSAYAPQNGYDNANDATFSGVIASLTLADYSVKSGLATTWQTFKDNVFLGAGYYTAEFVFNTKARPAADVVIDQVYVIATPPAEVPEPGSLALLGLGLAGLAAVSRRKQKQA
jgi:hypothetical protein